MSALDPAKLTWTYTGDGELSASGHASLTGHTAAVLANFIAAMDPTEELLGKLLDDGWDTPFELTITRSMSDDEHRFTVEVRDEDHLTSAVVVLLYILSEADQANITSLEVRP